MTVISVIAVAFPAVLIASKMVAVLMMAIFIVRVSFRPTALPQLLDIRSLASVQDALCFLNADAAGGISERASATASVADLSF